MAVTPTLRGALVSASVAVVALVAVVAGAVWMIDATPHDHPEPAAPAMRPALVHLGDSYASGAGTSPLVEDSPLMCQRSAVNFGETVGRMRGLKVTDVSCAGATTDDLSASQYDGVAPQLDALGPDTAYVTVMIGGNDSALFTTLVGECTRLAQDDPTGAPCRSALGRRPFREISAGTGPAVAAGLREIRSRAPRAEVFIVGYPWLMPEKTTCRPAVGIADGDAEYVHRVEAALNGAIATAARETGATYIDMAARSIGHEACSPRGMRWIEPQIGADSPIVMHPNEAGQRAIADAVAQHIR
ncbi:esterase [Gordonia sp. QH-12]|nr:esterase [Gordonia sp. QH-12]